MLNRPGIQVEVIYFAIPCKSISHFRVNCTNLRSYSFEFHFAVSQKHLNTSAFVASAVQLERMDFTIVNTVLQFRSNVYVCTSSLPT